MGNQEDYEYIVCIGEVMDEKLDHLSLCCASTKMRRYCHIFMLYQHTVFWWWLFCEHIKCRLKTKQKTK